MYSDSFLDSYSILEKLANKQAIRKAKRDGQYQYDKAVRKYGADSPYTQRVAAKHGINTSPVAPSAPMPSPVAPSAPMPSPVAPAPAPAPDYPLARRSEGGALVPTRAPEPTVEKSRMGKAMDFLRRNKKAIGIAGGTALGAYGAKKLYDKYSAGREKKAAYEDITLEKIASSKDKNRRLAVGAALGGGAGAITAANSKFGGKVLPGVGEYIGGLVGKDPRRGAQIGKYIGKGLGIAGGALGGGALGTAAGHAYHSIRD